MDTNTIIWKALAALESDPRIFVFNPRIRVENDAVILDGTVDAHWKRAAVDALVKDAVGSHVENNLAVALPDEETGPDALLA
ncbi:MAG TPA: hypothetical protein DHV36_18530 [Desulfobacteraceae bacterium]|nr:hypothetical protein [Desulfobacteraceae bacterium]|tara:strand:+ start:186 stop:431 length:246 start_codon:yes stop_codon:yes gene_type:complete